MPKLPKAPVQHKDRPGGLSLLVFRPLCPLHIVICAYLLPYSCLRVFYLFLHGLYLGILGDGAHDEIQILRGEHPGCF